ncbi:hypothetical protein NPIL_42921 [Nephila pilipes]|uniref:Uncharacterized protein n=1 Tax=Nephila pilipes TaxID=299642 RepID=A0A8X6NRK7_NEPPI|nr:hypothetical protein NPIL_42921 [Nephila pilipes]
MLLIPWLVMVLITTCVDLLISMYLLIEAFFNPFLAVLFGIDVVILSINIYSWICVFSQYQEYCAGRGNPQVHGNRPLPEVEYMGERCGASNAARITNDSGATNSSTVSVVQSSSIPGVHSEMNSAEESLVQYRSHDEKKLTEKDSTLDASNIQENDHSSMVLIMDPENIKEIV